MTDIQYGPFTMYTNNGGHETWRDGEYKELRAKARSMVRNCGRMPLIIIRKGSMLDDCLGEEIYRVGPEVVSPDEWEYR